MKLYQFEQVLLDYRITNRTMLPIMLNSYIIELFRWNPATHAYEKKDDCTMDLDLSTGDFKIQSVDLDGKTKLSAVPYMQANVITENVAIISRERHNIASMYGLSQSTALPSLTIDYEMIYKNNKFGIRFDARSSAAEKNFFNEFTKLREKVEFAERYASGNKKIEGTKTDAGYNGFCIEYYDTADSPIKYMGEFEDGLYDGEGEFFSADGNIRLICKNICAGRPNGVGQLIVGRNRVVKTIEMKQFVSISSKDDSYTNKIYKTLEPKYDEVMERMNFEAMTIEARTMYLFQELQKLRVSVAHKPGTGSFFNIF